MQVHQEAAEKDMHDARMSARQVSGRDLHMSRPPQILKHPSRSGKGSGGASSGGWEVAGGGRAKTMDKGRKGSKVVFFFFFKKMFLFVCA